LLCKLVAVLIILLQQRNILAYIYSIYRLFFILVHMHQNEK
jgi:hypothetical protein